MNEHVAFYRKYRPGSLSELIGQGNVKESLSKAFLANKLSHAYLFVGPRGTGKTSTARILAKMVNCLGENPPCNKCESCLSIAEGSNLDLIEIDAASNRGIEDIRLLREKIKLAPSSAKKKVYIIDEVHMLTTEAFNALLKTLEEPPAHTLFILATTEIAKVPQTIMSRCIRLDFTLATVGELRQALEKIAKAEKIEIEEEALTMLIKKAGGSFRDGVKILDQLAGKNSKISITDISESFKGLDFESIVSLVRALADKKRAESLLKIQELVNSGVDIKEAILSLMDTFRQLMFIKNGLGESLTKPHYTQEKYDSLVKMAQSWQIKEITQSLDVLQRAYEKLKVTSIPQLPLELAVMEICESADQGIGQPEVKVSEKVEIQVEQVPEIDEVPVSEIPTMAEGPKEVGDSADIAKLKEKWTYILETVRSYNFSLEALLRSARINECTQVTVMIEVPYSFHQRILEAPKNRELLEGVLSEVLGRSMRVTCVLGTRPVKKEEVANIELAQDDEIIRVAAEIFNSDSVN